MNSLAPVDKHVRSQLNDMMDIIEKYFDSDVLAVLGDLIHGLENRINTAIEFFPNRKSRLAIVLDTVGGIVEVVERTVNTIRNYYDEVYFIIPDRALSAGTLLALSGDKIFMSSFSSLGPVDPQIERIDNNNVRKLVPAMSYLNQYHILLEKADNGQLNTADITLLNSLDIGELYQFEQAYELSKGLLKNWICMYKFKNLCDEDGKPLSEEEKYNRAEEIANYLSDHKIWHSHARMISKDFLSSPDGELRLNIDDIDRESNIYKTLMDYVYLMRDYLAVLNQSRQVPLISIVHTKHYI